jgi:PST family polysaccharide transporter
VLSLFRDFGLSSAAIQSTGDRRNRASTLFWINVFVGALLGVLTLAAAPAVAVFYHEPRLVGVTARSPRDFCSTRGCPARGHPAARDALHRLAVVNTVALVISSAAGIGGALAGFYASWALVAMTVSLPLSLTIGMWMATGWMPGRPHRRSGMRSMMRFGSLVTLNGVICYVAYNLDKVLLGRVGRRRGWHLRRPTP